MLMSLFPSGLGQLSAAILECLRGYSSGLRVETLKKMLCQRQAMDLEDFVKYGGYGNTVELLQQVPEVQLLFPERGEKCLVRLKTGKVSWEPWHQPL